MHTSNVSAAPPEASSEAGEIKIEEHFGLVTKIVLRSWRGLPPTFRSYYDLEDMIADALVVLWQGRNRYDPKRGRPSTFVGCLVNNFCRSRHYYATRLSRTAVCIPLDDLLMEPLPSAENSLQVKEAVDALEQLIASGSEQLQDFLEQLFQGNAASWHAVEEELRMLIKRHAIRRSDFETVFHYAIA